MPTHAGKDAKGCYCQYGTQKKYYYECGNKTAKARAWAKAEAQGKKIKSTGWTENEGEKRMFQFVTANIKPTVRNDTMEGRDWLVGPVVMITEGVHNGSDGPIYYPPEELGKLPVAWNHKPVVVYHPQHNGMTKSACDPIELTSRKVGVLMNTNFDDKDKKLKSEAWLEPARMEVVDNRIAESIEKNEVMEVSTGLFMDLEKVEGEWNGEKYIGIARNIQPDHLALLPDLKGACSIEDGAGFLRVNHTSENMIIVDEGDAKGCIWINEKKGIGAMPVEKMGPVNTFIFNKKNWTSDDAKAWTSLHKGTTISTLILNEMGHESIRRLLSSQIQGKDENAWIEEVYDLFFIYEKEGKLYRHSYVKDNGSVKLSGESEEVVKVIEYRKADGTFLGNTDFRTQPSSKSNVPDNAMQKQATQAKPIYKKTKSVSNQLFKKGEKMEKSQLVDVLIENEKTKWTENDRDELMSLSETMLINMSELIKEPVKNEPEIKTEEKPTGTAAATINDKVEVKTTEQYIAEAPEGVREMLQAGMTTLKREKDRLIAVITANERNTFTNEHLAAKPVEELTALAKLAAKEKAEVDNAIPLYIGQGDTPDVTQHTEEPLLLPTMNFEQKKAG